MPPFKKLNHLYRASAAALALFNEYTELGLTERAAQVRAMAVEIERDIADHVRTNLSSKAKTESLS